MKTRTAYLYQRTLDRVALIAASCITCTLRACNLTRARVKSATSAASAYFAYECVMHIAIYTFDRLAYGREEGRKVAKTGDKEDGSITLPPSYLHNFKYSRFLFPQSRETSQEVDSTALVTFFPERTRDARVERSTTQCASPCMRINRRSIQELDSKNGYFLYQEGVARSCPRSRRTLARRGRSKKEGEKK